MTDERILIPSINKSYIHTINQFKARLKVINNWLDNVYDDTLLNEIDPEELGEIIYRLETLALSCRYAIATSTFPIEDEKVPLAEFAALNYPVSVDFSNETLTVTTPISFLNYHQKKNMVRNFLLSSYVEFALRKWQKDKNIELYNLIDHPIIVIMQRCAYKWNPSKYCDSDNLESSKIINEIVIRGLGYSDNARNMTVITTYKEVNSEEENCTKFIVFARKNLSKHVTEI